MSPGEPRRICVTGATSHVAGFLLPRLTRAGHVVHAVSRRPAAAGNDNGPLCWHRLDIGKEGGLDELPRVDALIHLAPLWLLAPRIEAFSERGVTRIIAFGSTSLFTKAESPDAKERELAAALRAAEARLAAACAERGIDWTVFRPTLTYGGGRDNNVALIGRLIRRFGFFPLAGQAYGKRQPVHAEDLAIACLSALNCAPAHNRAYDLSGAEALSYRQMVERIFRSQGRKPRFVRLSPMTWRIALGLARLWRRQAAVNAEMAARMNDDLVFDHGDARRDFGYAPRPFKP